MCERYVDRLPLTCLQLGTWPKTQACALTGNRTSNPLVHRPALNPLSHTSQGYNRYYFFICSYCLLLVYRNMIDFCMWPCFSLFQNEKLIVSVSFFHGFLGVFYTDSAACKQGSTVSVLLPVIAFSCNISLSRKCGIGMGRMCVFALFLTLREGIRSRTVK